ncbi:MAG: cadherin domain-containing protein, partial [Anaerolineae bacterium]
DVLTYTITAGDVDAIFDIDSSSGQITVTDNTNLDYEVRTQYVLSVQASDGSLTDTAAVTVSVTNVNDNTPVITDTTRSISEDAADGASVGAPVAGSDADDDVLTYTITAGDVDTIFGINASSGQITVTDNTNLDYETTPQYVLTVQASDATFSSTASVTISVTNVNDNAPVITDTTRIVSEDAANGASVGAPVTGTDPDGDTLSYSITNGNTSGVFAINAGSGQITVTNNTSLDYETTTQYVLTVQAWDGVFSDTAAVTVSVTNVNDNAPVITGTTSSVSEDAVNGTTVGTPVTGTDLDGDVLTYTITAGNGDSIFAINGSSGQITVTNNTSLDYETTTQYVLTVQAWDGIFSNTAAVTVSVTNVNDNAPVISDTTRSVSEDAANGTTVGTPVTGIDPDGDVLTYTITAGNGDSVFAINGSSGQITVTDNTSLDYETTTQYVLTVAAADGVFSSTAAVTVSVANVNDNTPLITDTTRSVGEDAVNGYLVGAPVTGSDADGGVLTHTITAGDTDSIFGISGSNGQITVTDNTNLDYETTTQYVLTVAAADGVFSSTAAVTVSITNVDANLGITKTVVPTTAIPGQPVTYTLVFSNAGPDAASFTLITDTVPITITNLSWQGVADSGPITRTSGVTYSWSVANLAAGQGGTITVTGEVDLAMNTAITFYNTALITTTADDATTGNNSSSDAGLAPIRVYQTFTEAISYTLVYMLEIPDNADYDSNSPAYIVDNSASIGAFDRVAYAMVYEAGGDYISMPAFTTTVAHIGFPVKNLGVTFAFTTTDVNLYSDAEPYPSVPGTGKSANVEFWPHAYTPISNTAITDQFGQPIGSDAWFDANDSITTSGSYSGSFQIHVWDSGTEYTIISWNNWDSPAVDDLTSWGMDDDGTGVANADLFSVKTLYILVHETGAMAMSAHEPTVARRVGHQEMARHPSVVGLALNAVEGPALRRSPHMSRGEGKVSPTSPGVWLPHVLAELPAQEATTAYAQPDQSPVTNRLGATDFGGLQYVSQPGYAQSVQPPVSAQPARGATGLEALDRFLAMPRSISKGSSASAAPLPLPEATTSSEPEREDLQPDQAFAAREGFAVSAQPNGLQPDQMLGALPALQATWSITEVTTFGPITHWLEARAYQPTRQTAPVRPGTAQPEVGLIRGQTEGMQYTIAGNPRSRVVFRQAENPAGFSVILTPTFPAALTSTTPISIEGFAASDQDVSALDVTIDGVSIYSQTWGAGITETTWSTSWIPPAEGIYEAEAALTNGGAQVITDSTETLLYVDLNDPELDLGTSRINSDNSSPGRIVITGTVTDTVGIVQVQARMGVDGAWQTAKLSTTPEGATVYGRYTATLPISLTDVLTDSSYVVGVRVVDRGGHAVTLQDTIPADVVPPNLTGLSLTAEGQAVSPGATVDWASAPILLLSWDAASDPNGVTGYRVEWLEHISTTLVVRETANLSAAQTIDAHTAGEAQKLSARVTVWDSFGNERSETFGPFYVDYTTTPVYVDTATLGRYQGWLAESCNLEGRDSRLAQNGVSSIGDQQFYSSWSAEGLRLAWSGADWNTDGDLFVYLDTSAGGSTVAYNPYPASQVSVAIFLPTDLGNDTQMAADYLVWVQDGDTASLLSWDGSQWV